MVSSIVKSRSYPERDLAVTRISSLSGADARAANAEPLSHTPVSFTHSLIARDARVGTVRHPLTDVHTRWP